MCKCKMYYFLNLCSGDIFLNDIVIHKLKIQQNTKKYTLGTENFIFK